MSAAVIYFSLSGNTKLAAEAVAKALSADLIELQPKKPYPKNGFARFIVCALTAIGKKAPELSGYTACGEAGLIVIASPIWAGGIATPVRTFLSENDLSQKKIAYLATSGDGSGPGAEEIKRLQPGAELISELSLCGGREDNAAKASAWARTL